MLSRPQLIAAAVAELPAEKPRVLVGLTQPLELLQAVRASLYATYCSVDVGGFS
jgi:hypothetical protein